MDEKEFIELKKYLLNNIDLPDNEFEVFKTVLYSCLKKEETENKYLAIQISGLEGTLKRYKFSFNFLTALTLIELAMEDAGCEFDWEHWIMIILRIITTIYGFENISLDPAQVIIITELYNINKNIGRSISEEDIYARLKTQLDKRNIEKEIFDEALEKLRKLNCIEITQGNIKLIEKVRF